MSATFQSHSPIDHSVVWSGDETTPDQVTAVMGRADAASQAWRATDVAERVAVVRRYSDHIARHRDQITDLISREVGKLRWDAAAEVGAAIAKAETTIRAMEQRRSTEVIDDGALRRTIRYQPLGVTLVLGPFNFPLHLPGGQIIPALLAGNAVVMKPSEQATAVGQWMADAWRAAGLPDDVLQLIVGRSQPAITAIDSAHVKGVFLTGGRAAGEAIHRQLAGRYDVLLALELGGNNPIVVLPDVAANQVAATVSFSAFISAGQRCTCARRAIFVQGSETQRQLSTLIQRAEQLQIGLPGDDPAPQVGPLISEDAAGQLRQTYDRMIDLGCQTLVPWRTDSRRENLVHPSVLDASELTQSACHELAQLEWFGPLLVVHCVQSFDAAVKLAADTTYGLAAALLGGDGELFERFANQVGAGVVNWNRPTTGAAGILPFGGLGESGNHRPAGYFAIDFCSDPVASLESESISDDDPWNVAK